VFTFLHAASLCSPCTFHLVRICVHAAADGNTRLLGQQMHPLIVLLAAELQQQHMLLLHACLTDAGLKSRQPFATGQLYLLPRYFCFVTC
jgi:hypothetical protein